MKLYKFDSTNLLLTEVSWKGKMMVIAAILVLQIVAISLYNLTERIKEKRIEDRVMVIISKQNEFSKEKLITAIKDLHFQFPHIVYAQAVLESSNFKSKMFMENNNLFGMREATQRINLSKGTQANHAYYSYWMDSVYDYALYCATYLSKLKTEDDYYNYLSQSYAEDGSYIDKLKNIVTDDLKSKFN